MQNDITERGEIIYADPPYIGQAKKHYGLEEVDHKALILDLEAYDGWALSLSGPTLQQILAMCPSVLAYKR